MKWLRFAGQYINTGIAPGVGYRIATTMRMSNQVGSTMPIFGSRNTAVSNAPAFNMFFISTFVTDHYENYLRADYGGSGSTTAFPIDFTGVPFDEDLIFSIDFGKNNRVNDATWTAPTNTTGNAFPIYVGSINDGGTIDNRAVRADFSEFIIYDASDVELFHGMPVPTGSTEYSVTPAPSNCYWDLVSQTYKQKTGGSNVIWYENDEDNLTDDDSTTVQGADYGLKVLAEGDLDVAYMNSKYPLFGSDISNPDSQFKTYEFTLTGFNSEPSPPFPAYVTDGNFYSGSGTISRTAYTVDTGFAGGKVKSIIVQHTDVLAANWQARAREQLTNQVTGENYNSLLNPASKVVPGYINLGNPAIYIVDGDSEDITVLSGQFGSATFNTLGSFNGGTLTANYFVPPQVIVNLDEDGILTVKTVVPYNWIQRAFNSVIGGTTYQYRARWRDWAWYQGVVVTVTVLNTPYTIE